MTTQQTIPLDRLVPSVQNVRRTGKDDGLGELMASIAAHGLRQSLNVKALDGGRYEVVAGGRRLRALKKLAKVGAVAKDMSVPCLVLGDGDDPAEISLVENMVRVAMRPCDQFEAFKGLIDGKGMTIEAVAERFGVTPVLVEQRMKLASVAPRLFDLFRKGDLSLAQVMAFTVSDDHTAQERVWKARQQLGSTPHAIRRALTEGSVAASDRLALFVGLTVYGEAGGGVVRDLFDEGNSGYLTDRPLLLRLAGDKLAALVEPLRAEGWKWVRAELEPDHSIVYRHVYPLAVEEDDGDEAGESSGGVTGTYAAEDMARAEALLRIGYDGTAQGQRGLIHPDDCKAEAGSKVKANKPDPAKGELAASLVEDLTAHRSAALRLELSRNPTVALAATVHALALQLCYPLAGQGSCLAIRPSSESLERFVRVVDDCAAHQAMQAEAERWRGILPGDPADLFGWCLAQPQEVLLGLLAFAAALGVNAVQLRHEHADTARLVHADRLAEALALDMAQYWRPSVEGFYGRLPKVGLIQVVSEAQAPVGVSISAIKKDEAARYVRKAVDGRGWLPGPLRAKAALADVA